MGTRTTAKKTSVKRPKTTSIPKPKTKRVTGGRVNKDIIFLGEKIDKAVLQMTTSIAESNARFDARIAESNARLEARIAETDARIAESNANIEKSISAMRETTRKLSESLAKSTAEMNKRIGDVGRSIGRVVEMVLLPGLLDKMNALADYQFDIISSDRIFKENGQEYAEIDLFLENGVSVMAVEAKTRVKLGEVNDFIEKLEKLREHEVKAGLVGKTIYAAVAGITFDDAARKAAEAKGMYLVSIDQNNDRIKIESPKCEVGKW